MPRRQAVPDGFDRMPPTDRDDQEAVDRIATREVEVDEIPDEAFARSTLWKGRLRDRSSTRAVSDHR